MSCRWKFRNGILPAALALTPLLVTTAPPPAIAESLIEEATRFTVKLRVSVEYPFMNERKGTSNGTGFVVDRKRGWIVTNAHMAKFSPSKIQVVFKDRQPIVGKKIYVDTHIDMAVVEAPVDSLPDWAGEAALGCEDEPVPGQQVVAFGHPWNLDFTATRGIVSGKRFRSNSEAIQTDAAINPGNSGGTLIDAQSRKVIGINEASYGNDRGSIGIAIPVKLACTILDLLKQGKDPSPPKLPAIFATTTMDRELFVATVKDGWASVLKPGDRIMAVNGNRMHTNISRIIDQSRGRPMVDLTYLRDGAEQTGAFAIPNERETSAMKGLFVSGMLIADSPYPEAEQDVLHVHFVDDASAADVASFRRGDQIVSIDGIPVKTLAEAQDLLSKKTAQQTSIIVRRRLSSGDLNYMRYLRKLEISKVQSIE